MRSQKAKVKEMVPPKAKIKNCQREFQESATNGLDGVHAPKRKLANLVSIPTPRSTKDVAKVFRSAKTKREKARMAKAKIKEQLVAILAVVPTSNVIARSRRRVKAKDDISHRAEKVAKEKEKAVGNPNRLPNKNANFGTQAHANMIHVNIINREIAAIGQAPKVARNNIAIGGTRHKRKAQL